MDNNKLKSMNKLMRPIIVCLCIFTIILGVVYLIIKSTGYKGNSTRYIDVYYNDEWVTKYQYDMEGIEDEN